MSSKMFSRGVVVGLVTGVSCCTAGYAGYQRLAIQAPPLSAEPAILPESTPKLDVDYEELKSQKDIVSRILRYGVPQQAPSISVYQNHVLRYDQERRIPRWVAETITRHHVHGEANRRQSKFFPDPSVPDRFSAQNTDYWNSGWSRGHMAPAGNNKHDQVAMDETFLLSNVLPQDIDNNAGFWNRLEMYCRDLTKRFSEVHIVSGPLFLPCVHVEDGGKTKKFVKYEVLGSSEVAVPTHLFKVIVTEDEGRVPCVGAFVVPNEPIAKDRKLLEYQVPLEFVESKTGLVLLPLLSRSKTKNLCNEIDCSLIPWDKFELYFIGRKLEGARTLRRLDKVWKELGQKNLVPDEALIAAYRSKRKQLEDLRTNASKEE